MTKFKWLNEATSKIYFGPNKAAVRRELEDHLLDRQERYQALGLPADQAEAAAVADMGDAGQVAVELGRLHRPWWGYLWRASQVMVGLSFTAFLCVWLITQAGTGDFPGQQLYEYLTWEGSDHFSSGELLDRQTCQLDRMGKSGRYTIHANQLTLDTVGKGTPFRVLYIDCNVTRPIWSGPWSFSDAIRTVTDSTGATYSPHFVSNAPHYAYRDNTQSFLGQKFRLMLWYVPEDVVWVELTFGYGELERTMRLEISKEVAP